MGLAVYRKAVIARPIYLPPISREEKVGAERIIETANYK
jgi:hypothetical protein